jgi:MFS family permease
MNEDLNLVKQDYSWLGSIFYFGYLAAEGPTIWALTRVPIGKFMGTLLLLWGTVICAMAGCKNFATMATARFFLGVFEAALLPVCMLLTSIYYRRSEQPLISALYCNTFAGVSTDPPHGKTMILTFVADFWRHLGLCHRSDP